MVFQVNGRVHSRTTVEKGASKETLLSLARDDEKIRSWLEGKTIVKKIVVPDKLVNIVVK